MAAPQKLLSFSIDDLVLAKALGRFFELAAQEILFKLPLGRHDRQEMEGLRDFLRSRAKSRGRWIDAEGQPREATPQDLSQILLERVMGAPTRSPQTHRAERK